jgi:hypothetical protein
MPIPVAQLRAALLQVAKDKKNADLSKEGPANEADILEVVLAAAGRGELGEALRAHLTKGENPTVGLSDGELAALVEKFGAELGNYV